MADFSTGEIEQLRLLLPKISELLSIADDAAALDVVAGAGQETINELTPETAAGLNQEDLTVIGKHDASATKSLTISNLVSFVSGQIGGGGTEFNKQGHFKWVAGGGDGGTGYKLKDIVYHNGNTYISTADNNTTEPGAALASWEVYYGSDTHDPTRSDYKNGARVQDGFGGNWYEAVQDVPVNTLITNPLFWLPSSNFKIFNSDDVLTTGRDLTASDINKHLVFNNALPQTFNLPPVNSIPSGSVIYVRGGQSIATFNCSGADAINVTNGSTVTSCSCFGSEAVMLVSNGIGDWRLTKINPRYQYSSLTANRAYNTEYTNQTGFELEVLLTFNPPNASNTSVFPFVNGDSILGDIRNNTISRDHISFRVPPGATYRIEVVNLTIVFAWIEYRAVI